MHAAKPEIVVIVSPHEDQVDRNVDPWSETAASVWRADSPNALIVLCGFGKAHAAAMAAVERLRTLLPGRYKVVSSVAECEDEIRKLIRDQALSRGPW